MERQTAQQSKGYHESISSDMYMWFNQTERMYQLKYGDVFPTGGGHPIRDLVDSHPTLEGFAKVVATRIKQAQTEGSAIICNRPDYGGANVIIDDEKIVFKRQLDTQEFAKLEELVQKERRG